MNLFDFAARFNRWVSIVGMIFALLSLLIGNIGEMYMDIAIALVNHEMAKFFGR